MGKSCNSDKATEVGRERKRLFVASFVLVAVLPLAGAQGGRCLRAGAAMSNVTPWLGLSIDGGTQNRRSEGIDGELHGRCLVLDNGETTLVFVVVHSCALPSRIL